MLKGCYCQPMDTEDWQEKEFFWEQPRYFYRVTTRMALHSPISYSEDVAMAMMQAKTQGYVIKQNPLILLKSGLFRGEIFLEITPRQGSRQNAGGTTMLLPQAPGNLLHGSHQGAAIPDGHRGRQTDPEFKKEGAQGTGPLPVPGQLPILQQGKG